MNNYNDNFNGEDILDIKSPYIKNSTYSIDEVRDRISKRASDLQEKVGGHILSVNKELERGGSDTLLRQKITNVSKKVVGEEIKKFAEIAGKEISKEFENLEKRLEKKNKDQISERLNYFEQSMYDNLIAQNQNLVGLEKGLSEKIDSDIYKLNSLLSDIENRLKDLEVFSLSGNKNLPKVEEEVKDEDYTIIVAESKDEAIPVNENISVLEDMKEILNSSLTQKVKDDHVAKDPRIEKYYYDESNRELEEVYINEKIKNISDSFKKEGLLFNKNTFKSKLKDLNTEEFLNDSEESKNVDESDKERMSSILINLMDSLNIDPEEDENIEMFLKKCYQKEYREKK